jgi:hypothetical protein
MRSHEDGSRLTQSSSTSHWLNVVLFGMLWRESEKPLSKSGRERKRLGWDRLFGLAVIQVDAPMDTKGILPTRQPRVSQEGKVGSLWKRWGAGACKKKRTRPCQYSRCPYRSPHQGCGEL